MMPIHCKGMIIIVKMWGTRLFIFFPQLEFDDAELLERKPEEEFAGEGQLTMIRNNDDDHDGNQAI